MTNDPDSPEDDINLAPGTQPYAMVEDKIPRRQKIVNGTKMIALNPLKGTFMLASVIGIGTLNDSSIYRVFFADNTTAVVPLEKIRSLEQPVFCGELLYFCFLVIDSSNLLRQQTIALILHADQNSTIQIQ